MANAYKTVMRGSGITAAVVGAAWFAASAMSAGNGTEMPPQISTMGVMLVVCCTVIAGGAWVVERSHGVAAERHIRPLIREELDKALADSLPLLVSTITESLDRRIVPQMQEVAVAAGKQSAVRLRDMVTQDMREILNDAHRKAVVTGQVMQLNATGVAIGRAALRSIPTHASTFLED